MEKAGGPLLCILYGVCHSIGKPRDSPWPSGYESTLDPQAGWPGRYKNVRRCGGLPMVFL